jgi:porin-like protein
MQSDISKSSAKYALSLAALLAVGGTALPAAAADLGGNCCADLEERVAELEATTARKGNRKVSLTISGQVTTGVLAFDDGKNSDAFVVDNTNAGSTFFVLSGAAKINPKLTAGFDLAVSISAGARSNQVSQLDDDGGAAGDSNLALTRANWYLDHAQIGRLTVGRINTASAGVVGLDLGGIGVIANANVGYWNAGFLLDADAGKESATWGALLGGGTVNGAGLSRANAVMYTSPTFGGFSVSGSWGEDDFWDVALRYAGEHAGFRVAAAIAYADNVGGLGDNEDVVAVSNNVLNANNLTEKLQINQVKASASLLHVATGLFVQGSYLTQDNDTRGVEDTVLWQIQGGIAKNYTGLGNTVFYGEYANVSDAFGFTNSNVDIWGLGVVQHLDAAAMELFLSYRHYDGSADSVSAQGAQFGLDETNPGRINADFDAVFGGARIRF